MRLRRILCLLLSAAALLGACTDPGELGGPNPGGTVAARIGDFEVTNAALEDEVEQWAVAPDFLASIDPATLSDLGEPGRRSASLVAFVLGHRVISEQARVLAGINGYEPGAAEVDQILAQLSQGFGPAFDALDPDFARLLAADLAYQTNLQTLGAGGELPAVAVAVNPRYGQTRDVGGGLIQVDPPDGPVPFFAVG